MSAANYYYSIYNFILHNVQEEMESISLRNQYKVGNSFIWSKEATYMNLDSIIVLMTLIFLFY